MRQFIFVAFLLGVAALEASAETSVKKHHKKHHKHHHHHKAEDAPAVADAPKDAETPAAAATPKVTNATNTGAQALAVAKPEKKAAEKKDEKKPAASTEEEIMGKMKKLEGELAKKEQAVKGVVQKGRIEVNGPLPADFPQRFAQAVAKATGCDPAEVKVIETNPVVNAMLLQTKAAMKSDVVEVVFEAPSDVVKAVEDQVADPDSKLAGGSLKEFLVAKEETQADETPVAEKGIDIDTEMPYGELEPFGREDTAQELTEQSVKESDEMVDQLERAEVAAEKRSVFRALPRLRGAAITSFDGIARSQTGNIDEYNKTHKWRKTPPLHHLADEESDISKWAFPDNAD
jgi:hypothetical protein